MRRNVRRLVSVPKRQKAQSAARFDTPVDDNPNFGPCPVCDHPTISPRTKGTVFAAARYRKAYRARQPRSRRRKCCARMSGPQRLASTANAASGSGTSIGLRRPVGPFVPAQAAQTGCRKAKPKPPAPNTGAAFIRNISTQKSTLRFVGETRSRALLLSAQAAQHPPGRSSRRLAVLQRQRFNNHDRSGNGHTQPLRGRTKQAPNQRQTTGQARPRRKHTDAAPTTVERTFVIALIAWGSEGLRHSYSAPVWHYSPCCKSCLHTRRAMMKRIAAACRPEKRIFRFFQTVSPQA